MDKRQINKLEMARAVKNFLDSNAAIWSSIPIMTSTKTALDMLVTNIRTEAEKQEGARVHVSASKSEKKKIISEKIDILNDAAEAYAGMNDNAELAHKAGKSASDLFRLRNEDFITAAHNQLAMVEGILADLADFGITQDQLDDVKADVDDFLALEGQPRPTKSQNDRPQPDWRASLLNWGIRWSVWTKWRRSLSGRNRISIPDIKRRGRLLIIRVCL